MGMIKKALLEYEKLIGTEISLSLNNGDMIHFVFKPAAFPHLVGLQYLVDITDLFEYKEGRLPAFDLYSMMKNKDEQLTVSYEKSRYFQDLYDSRIKYFSASRILDIIFNGIIVKFDPRKVHSFNTKLEKVDSFFFEGR